MRGVSIFSFDEYYEDNFKVIAIHTILEDYKLAYFLNDYLKSDFKRLVPDLDYIIEGEKVFFSSFKYENLETQTDWFLIKNKFKDTNKSTENTVGGLFEIDEAFNSTYVYLQPEIKEADFILKIEDELLDQECKDLLIKLNKIRDVVTAYEVDTQILKHKEYLIF